MWIKDPDPDPVFSRIRIRIRVTKKDRIRPDPDPDPQHWLKQYRDFEVVLLQLYPTVFILPCIDCIDPDKPE